jgi:ABC-2 type transport system permease protein
MSSFPRSDGHARLSMTWVAARRPVRSGAALGALFGLLTLNEAFGFDRNFPDEAARQSFAQTFGTNSGLAAVIGPGHALDTLEGFVSWRMFGLMYIVGAVWGLLTATRALRGEEDAGRWELLVAGPTSRRAVTARALVGLALGWLALWAATAVFIVAAGLRSDVGFAVSASLFYATAATASAALFLGVGALVSQIWETRRQANAWGGAILAVAYLVRLWADSGAASTWVRWLSPLGWVENLRPLTGSEAVALVPIAGAVLGCVVVAVVLAGRRDVGAGVWRHSSTRNPSTALLDRPAHLVLHLERYVALTWVFALATTACIFGVTARVAATSESGVSGSLGEAVGRWGGHASGSAAWLGYEFVFVAAIAAFAAIGQISALRAEEASGHVEHLLARPFGRVDWLVSRLAFAVGLVVVAGLAAGVAGWVGVGATSSGISWWAMTQAGLNVSVAGCLVLGIGTMLFGLVPRLAVPLLYAFVLWSFLAQILGTSITDRDWVLNTSLLANLDPVPASPFNVAAVAALIAVALIGAVVGTVAFRRRDLSPV